MKKAIFPGSFDPFTIGHLDLLERAARLFDSVVVGVLVNEKKNCVFSRDERIAMIETVVKARGLNNVTVKGFGGLLCDFVRAEGATCVVRGLRGEVELDAETINADVNRRLGGVETVFLPARAELASISSSVVREVLHFNGDARELVPEEIYNNIKGRMG